MLPELTSYYFSPTGGTKKVADLVCRALSEQVIACNLGQRSLQTLDTPCTDVIVVAAPVFAGRIPAIVTEKLRTLHGDGKFAITLAVYGNRDFDDALLELNDTLTDCGFRVIASSACIAQHSQLPQLAAGRPDAVDQAGLGDFAVAVLEKLTQPDPVAVSVPGNRPYRPMHPSAAAPMSSDACTLCGLCASLCPTGAITLQDTVQTEASQRILCRACTAHCPTGARVVPAQLDAALLQKLSPFIDVRRENLYCL